MKLGTRLLLAGAIVPGSLLLAGSAAGAIIFEHFLLEAVDRTLLGQVAVEAVSLFDGPDGRPHLHLDHSPLASQLVSYAASGALYGPDGSRAVVYPEGSAFPTTIAPPQLEGAASEPRLTTRPGHPRTRVLEVEVRAPDGGPHALVLSVSLGAADEAVALYNRTAGLGVLLIVLVAGIFQILHARSLTERVHGLARHMARLREGDFDRAPPADRHEDVIAELRSAIADTTERLAAARDSRDRLIADAAHELRTPLAAMRTTIDVILRRDRSKEELAETLREVREEVIRLGDLATRLLDLARLRASRFEQRAGDLRAVVDEAVEHYRLVAEERRVSISVDGPASAPALFAVDALRQAIENLLSNALRFAPEGTRVEVALDRLASPGQGW